MSSGWKPCCLALGLMLAIPAQAAPAKWDLVTHNAIAIDAPPARIWPHILTLEWKQGAKLVPVDRPPGQAPNRYKAVMGDATLFYVEDVELVPDRLRTIRLDEAGGGLIGYASLQLTPNGRQTVVRYDVYTALPLPSAADAATLRKDSALRFDQELIALKRIVESGK